MAELPIWLHEPALQQLFAATRDAGGELRAVGGAVRDHLLGREAGDVDMASNLTPEQTMALAAQQGWKAIPTGIAHGTVTVVLPRDTQSKRVVEITTLRRDVETDGRHATVAYTDDFAEDAARRDFTINALSMGADGVIHDYFNGRADIEAKCLRFIGEAATRIDEDGLRILRYFRFLAQLGWAADEDTVMVCRAKRGAIAHLSGERIAQEMRKLLVATSPALAVEALIQAGLPECLTETAWKHEGFAALLNYERFYGVQAEGWVRLLSLIVADERNAAAMWVAERWKLSRAERDALAILAMPLPPLASASVKYLLRTQPRGLVVGRILLAALENKDVTALQSFLTLAQQWEIPIFPVTAKDLLARGHTQGKALGDALKALEQRWEASDYQLTREALLA
jgi:tRNA nucleotidyltransferase/poly(A) polymerase